MSYLINTDDTIKIIEEKANTLSEKDKGFLLRVWGTEGSIYRNRLRAIGFTKMDNVLDAGCGYGQWSIYLAELNQKVHCIDYSKDRIQMLNEITNELKIENLTTRVESIEKIDSPDNTYDAIFCYSVIFITDYRKSVAEFARVLKPGGKIYINSNGLGWYLHNIMSGHNSTSDFDSRQMGIETIENTFDFLASGTKKEGGQIVIPGRHLQKELEQNGFKVLSLNGDGEYSEDDSIPSKSFFKGTYLNAEGVYEIIAEKVKY